ncbi:uncharacterized protein Bfra_010608 [Botrytis fragariae]|uniref:Uncharacterized protein n=1 Tax=Botrytis fragariae TaxID=1964551 RepID=A0A8H6ECZ3_9HELO|nr:uncharacterized protein Bfra_010608 [Botrytis fragariae]KAF5867633.1 hypothetical protein Bfra_010608 [Botrytis fragariae]
MKTQSFSTPGPISSPKIALRKEMSQNSTPNTLPSVRMLSPPGAPHQRRFLRPEVAPQSDGAFRTSHNLRGRSTGRMCIPRPRQGQNSRNIRSRSPPRDRVPVYRNRSLVNDRLFGGRATQRSSLGPFLIESIEKDTVMNNVQPSSSHDMNERFQSVLSLADTERKEQATRSKISGLPSSKSLHTKSKEIESGSFKKSSEDSSDEEDRFWAKKSSK